ncbi:hypothetical protein EUTSA_v10028044mg [Eutrema salsugineum]|uniref:Uncharacterized protein n=1 Tax=Eutrema salsugineum TaxID=72664 RepID=V4LW54_EUTSA|nr:hypothetical protein EUTSA_v10028044mg [Eutrema salsugineum]
MEGVGIKETGRNHGGDREIGSSEMGIPFAAKLRFRSRFRSSIDSYCFAREAFSDPRLFKSPVDFFSL